MLKNTLLVTVFLIISSVLGFTAQIVFASSFGASVEMDLHFKILSVPAIITGISPIIFSSVLIPIFAKFKSNKSDLNKFIKSIWELIIVFGVMFMTLGCLFSIYNMEKIINTKSIYLSQLSMQICLLVWVGSGFAFMSGFLSAVLNYRKKFIKVIWTNILPASLMIIIVLFFHNELGVRCISLGFCIAFILQFIIFAKEVKISCKNFSFDIKNIPFKMILFERSILVTLSLLPFTVLVPIAYFWGSKLEVGSISYLGYSQSFAGFLSVAVSMGISIVSFPDLADKFANAEGKLELYKFEKSLRFVLLIGMFAAGALIVLRTPILSIFYNRGSFNSESVNNLAKVIPWYLLAAIFVGGVNLLRNLFYSKGEFKSIAILGIIIPIIFFVLAGVLKNIYSFVGIGIANTLTCAILFFSTIYLAKNKAQEFLNFDFFILFAKSIISVVLTSALVAYALKLISNLTSQIITILMCLLIFTSVYYILTQFIFKIDEIAEIISGFKSKIKSISHL